MPKRLIDNVNSRYFEAANHMRPKWKKNKVIVFVESYDDIFFWRDVLSEFENDSLGFEVVLPSRTNLSRGKKSAMVNRLGKGLGSSMIACVDADYDYLMQGHTAASQLMLGNPYVIHTVVYAIENYQCSAESLHNVCVMATLNDHQIFDFVAFLQTYSRIIYDLFVWSMWFYRCNRGNEFSLTSFCNITMMQKLNIANPEEALDKLKKEVNRKIAYLQRNYLEAKGKIEPLKKELEELGLKPDNTYLYVQGHHLKDDVVMRALEPVCISLRKSREKEIIRLADHRQQMNNELSSYQHSMADLEQMLRRNTGYKNLSQYQQLRANITALLKRLSVGSVENDETAGNNKTTENNKQKTENND